MAVPYLLRLELLPSSPGSGITALKKVTPRSAFFRSQEQKLRRIWEKRASVREETASCGVLASLYLKQEVR